MLFCFLFLQSLRQGGVHRVSWKWGKVVLP